jgi:hypothetical protein
MGKGSESFSWRQNVTENERSSQKELATWLRRRLEGHAPAEILAQISDTDLVRQYEEDKARKVKMIQGKATEGKIKVRI